MESIAEAPCIESRPRIADGLMTAEEVAAQLGVHTQTVRSWAKNGRIPCLQPTQKWLRFRMNDVMESLAAGRAR